MEQQMVMSSNEVHNILKERILNILYNGHYGSVRNSYKGKRYYEVVAKCGHVGKDKYYRGRFYVKADSEQEAVDKVRYAPRVKKDHRDAILSVTRIGERKFYNCLIEQYQNPYFACTCGYEQDAIYEVIKEDILPETERQMQHKRKRNKGYSDDRCVELTSYHGELVRNPYKVQMRHIAEKSYNAYIKNIICYV